MPGGISNAPNIYQYTAYSIKKEAGAFFMKPLILIAGTMDVHRRYYELVQKSGMNAQMLSYRIGEAFPYSTLQNLSFDLLLLPGGGDFDPAFYGEETAGANPSSDGMLDLMQFQLLQLALVRKKPVIGICKGMQLIHVFFGGRLLQDLPGDNMHYYPYTTKDAIHSVQLLPLPSMMTNKECDKNFLSQEKASVSQLEKQMLSTLLARFSVVNSAHHQAVSDLPDCLICLQQSPDGIPETILHKELPIIGFQWHPERLPAFLPAHFAGLVSILLQWETAIY